MINMNAAMSINSHEPLLNNIDHDEIVRINLRPADNPNGEPPRIKPERDEALKKWLIERAPLLGKLSTTELETLIMGCGE